MRPVDSTKTYGSGFGQQFKNGWLYWSPETGYVKSSRRIAISYAALKGPSGLLGFPVSAPKSPTAGWQTQAFQRGMFYDSATYGIHYVLSSIGSPSRRGREV